MFDPDAIVYSRDVDEHAEAYAVIICHALYQLINNLNDNNWSPVAINRFLQTLKIEAMRQAGLFNEVSDLESASEVV